MKLTIAPGVLAAAIAWAARTLPARPSVPVLAGILLEAAADGTVTVKAFDYDVSATDTVEADTVSEPGKVLLPGRLLAEILKSLAKRRDMLDLAATDNECTITCGSTEYALQTMPVDDYPNLPVAPATVGTIDPDAFTLAVAQVHPAAGRDDTLPMLTGVRVDSDGTKLTLATTDRYRVGVHTTTWQPNGDQKLSALIPARTLLDVAKGLGSDPVQVGVTDGLASFTTAGRCTTVRTLENQFPDYEKFVNGVKTTRTATFDPKALAAAVKEVQVVAERGTGIRFHFTADQIRVQAGSPDSGRASETVPCELAGDDIEIAFQAAYLLDGLNAAGVGPVAFAMDTPTKPALLTAGDNFRYLAMSLRLS